MKVLNNTENTRRMANPENIKDYEWKPGMSGNPKGRPKGSRNIATMLKELLETIDERSGGEGDYGRPVANELVRIVFQKKKDKFVHSESARLRALEQIMERIEGKANLPISVSSDEERPNFTISFRNGDSVKSATAVQRHEPEAD